MVSSAGEAEKSPKLLTLKIIDLPQSKLVAYKLLYKIKPLLFKYLMDTALEQENQTFWFDF